MAVVNTKPPDQNNLLSSISIDMSTLSHSELHSLSLLTTTTTATTTVSTTAQFSINPSLSTHQQTYSPSPLLRRHRRFSFLNRERFESNLIVSYLRNHLKFDNSTPEENNKCENGNVTVEIVNRNGVVVDLAALEERESDGGPYAEELRKRADGRENEGELLEVLGRMDGDWCSRRKKRRVIDASVLGDALPVGWKLIIALRRKGGRFSPYCRHYISPTGEQLSSCKEVSSYLQSYFGISDAKLVRDSRVDLQQLQGVHSDDHMCVNSKDGNSMTDLSLATISNTCVPVEREKETSISGIDNLPDVRVCDLYECHSCSLSFDVKDKYLQHMFSLHQKTTRSYTLDSSVGDKVIIKEGKPEGQKKRKRRKLGSSVSDGVIIKDGKYQCQFCHKVFEERRRYLGHVGNHVKGSIKSDLPVQVNGHAITPYIEKSATANSRMDALIDIAQSSIQDINAPPVFEKEPSGVTNVDQLTVAVNMRSMDVSRKTGKNSSFCLNEVDTVKLCREGKTFSAELIPCEMVSGMSSVCPDETVREVSLNEGKSTSEELHPSCNRVNAMSMTNVDIDHLDPSPGEHGGEDTREDENLCLEFNSQAMMQDLPRANGNDDVLPSSPNELELEKDVMKDKTLSTELNPLAKMSSMSTTDGKIREQSFTCNIVDYGKNSRSEMTTIPVAKSGFADNVSSNGRCKYTPADDESSADEPVGGFRVPSIWCNEKASDGNSSGKKIQLGYVDKLRPEHARDYDDSELATAGKSDASGCTVPQISMNPSSTFDEIFEKAGQDICSLDQNLESVTGLEYMKLDVIEPQMYKYNAMSREDSISFYEVSMDLGSNIGLELGLDNSLKSQSEFPQEMARRCLTTTVCVWCGIEFSHEVADMEPQPDSVGFMCPGCRAKISKQFNELETKGSWRKLPPTLQDASSSLSVTFEVIGSQKKQMVINLQTLLILCYREQLEDGDGRREDVRGIDVDDLISDSELIMLSLHNGAGTCRLCHFIPMCGHWYQQFEDSQNGQTCYTQTYIVFSMPYLSSLISYPLVSKEELLVT